MNKSEITTFYEIWYNVACVCASGIPLVDAVLLVLESHKKEGVLPEYLQKLEKAIVDPMWPEVTAHLLTTMTTENQDCDLLAVFFDDFLVTSMATFIETGCTLYLVKMRLQNNPPTDNDILYTTNAISYKKNTAPSVQLMLEWSKDPRWSQIVAGSVENTGLVVWDELKASLGINDLPSLPGNQLEKLLEVTLMTGMSLEECMLAVVLKVDAYKNALKRFGA